MNCLSSCLYSSKQKYTFIANPDDLLTNDIKTLYVNGDKYYVLEKEAHIVQKCRKFYNIWNYRVIKNLTSSQHLLIISSQEKGRWYITKYNKNYLGLLPKNIQDKSVVFKIDYSVALGNNKKTNFFDVPLDD
jgi:hypothetical protein